MDAMVEITKIPKNTALSETGSSRWKWYLSTNSRFEVTTVSEETCRKYVPSSRRNDRVPNTARACSQTAGTCSASFFGAFRIIRTPMITGSENSGIRMMVATRNPAGSTAFSENRLTMIGTAPPPMNIPIEPTPQRQAVMLVRSL